jgi:hypothetical protein
MESQPDKFAAYLEGSITLTTTGKSASIKFININSHEVNTDIGLKTSGYDHHFRRTSPRKEGHQDKVRWPNLQFD